MKHLTQRDCKFQARKEKYNNLVLPNKIFIPSVINLNLKIAQAVDAFGNSHAPCDTHFHNLLQGRGGVWILIGVAHLWWDQSKRIFLSAICLIHSSTYRSSFLVWFVKISYALM